MWKLQRKRIELVLPVLDLSTRSKMLKGGQNVERGENLMKRYLGDSAVVCAVVPMPQDEKREKQRGVAFIISSPERQFFNDRVLSLRTVAQGLTSL